MTLQASSPLAHAYHQRRGGFVSEERVGDWRLKLYGLARPEQGRRPELLATTRELAARSLPALDANRYGAAFAIAHDARYPIALDLLVAGDQRAAPARLRRRPANRSDLDAGAVDAAPAASGSSGSSSSSAAPGSRT